MTTAADPAGADAILNACRLFDDPKIYAIGAFDDRVTVLTQQRRALNLAWAMVETDQIQRDTTQPRCRIAVVGGGFAGLTFAAALLRKQSHCTITLFEERDTLLPLQQGSDTRWLHPHIYDWPAEGSEAQAAMLPVLNWTAARASDVVVQVMSSWSDLVNECDTPLNLWCNTRHLQLLDTSGSAASLEWVGEKRDPATGGAISKRPRNAEGLSATFDIVVLAVGFGLEVTGSSYWRNEILGQPGLEHRRTPYMVSGQGDGAMIDLLRLKISQFRQDRILAELFGGKVVLVEQLRALRVRFESDKSISLYEAFDALTRRRLGDPVRKQMEQALEALTKRLRRDTEVVLQLKEEVRGIADLLGNGKLKASFQNALLVYMLYRCGGFSPASGVPDVVAARFKVVEPHIVQRHGVKRIDQLNRLLPKRIYTAIVAAEKASPSHFRQTSVIQWKGGYFGAQGREDEIAKLPDEEKAERKEYLPGPTSLFAASIAGAIVGQLLALRPGTTHLRVTLHRVITIHGEDLLQQACEYVGTGISDKQSTSGRVFPAGNATIGQAYKTRRIVRSQPAVALKDLDKAMKRLELNAASRAMAKDVHFLAALPILQSEDRFYTPSPVCAVLYLDSRDPHFDLDDAAFTEMVGLVSRATEAAQSACASTLDRLENTPLSSIRISADPAEPLPAHVAGELTIVATAPPTIAGPFTLNIDHSDVTPIAY